jgi:hypothetical protein
VALPSEAAEQTKLLSILPYEKFEASGIDGKPTVQFSGANVQIISGASGPNKLLKEEVANGAGNLVIGYDAGAGTQTGSNNLVLGTYGQTYTSAGTFLGGFSNSTTDTFAAVLGGTNNSASGYLGTVTGGAANAASGESSTVSGGSDNVAGGYFSSVSGGSENKATGSFSSILGGKEVILSTEYGTSP